MNQNVNEECFDISNSLFLKIYSALCNDELDAEDTYVSIVGFMQEDMFPVEDFENCAKHLIRLFKTNSLYEGELSIEESEVDIIKNILICFWENEDVENAKEITRRFFEHLRNDNYFLDFIYFVLTDIIVYVDYNFYIELFEKYYSKIEECNEPFFCSDILYGAASAYYECGTASSYDKAVETMNKCIQLREKEDFEGLFHARAKLQGALLKEELNVTKSEIESILVFENIQNEKDFLAECNLELGNICCRNGMLNEATEYFKNAIGEFSEELSSNYELYVLACNSLCEVYSKTNEMSNFYFYASKAYDFCEKHNVHGENLVLSINNLALSKFYLNDKVD